MSKKKTSKNRPARAGRFRPPGLGFAIGTNVQGQGSGHWAPLAATEDGTYCKIDGQRKLVCSRGHSADFSVYFSTKRDLLVILCLACGGHNEAEITVGSGVKP